MERQFCLNAHRIAADGDAHDSIASFTKFSYLVLEKIDVEICS